MNWVALLAGPLALLGLTLKAAKGWRRSTETVHLDPKLVVMPFISTIPVAALGIPIVATVLQEVVPVSPNHWVAELLLSALILAAIAVLTGVFVVYTVILESGDLGPAGEVQLGGGRFWLPMAMVCHYSSVVIFLFCIVGALVATVFHARVSEPQKLASVGTVSIGRVLPDLGATRQAVYELWGTPDGGDAERLEYRGKGTIVVFCFTSGKLREVNYLILEERHASANICATR